MSKIERKFSIFWDFEIALVWPRGIYDEISFEASEKYFLAKSHKMLLKFRRKHEHRMLRKLIHRLRQE